jgi:REP element-mobilizing transposase RayT
MQKSTPLEPSHYYHIYNRGNNRENIFFEDRNYHYFLRLYANYIEPVAETFAYCLMRNHFHVLVRIRTELAGQPFAGLKPAKGLTPEIVSRHFSNFFNSYAQAINKAYDRTGALFQKRFGRVLVDSDRYFLTLIHYIHFNPQKHGFVEDFRTYPYSSYSACLSTQPTRLKRQEVLNRFGDASQFANFHQELADEKSIQHLVEDDAD